MWLTLLSLCVCVWLWAVAFVFAWMEYTWTSTGGNQREIDRQRAAKRAEKGGKGKKKDADGNSAKQMLTNKKEKYVPRVPLSSFCCSLVPCTCLTSSGVQSHSARACF